MTEQEWLVTTDPTPMLELLRGKGSDRKVRLFAVSCSRRFVHLTHDHRVGEALDIAEQLADGLVGDAERSSACKAAQQAAQVRGVVARPDAPKWERRAASLAYYAAARRVIDTAWNVPKLAVEVLVWRAGGYNASDYEAIKTTEWVIQSDLLRDIFNNPFRPVAFDPAWRTSTAIAVARGVYDDKAFDRMPILADALMDAGCENHDILDHCRGEGLHVRGCWVVDLVLGKE